MKPNYRIIVENKKISSVAKKYLRECYTKQPFDKEPIGKLDLNNLDGFAYEYDTAKDVYFYTARNGKIFVITLNISEIWCIYLIIIF